MADAIGSGRNGGAFEQRRGSEERASAEGASEIGLMGNAGGARLEGRELRTSCDGNRGGQSAHGSTEQPGRALFPPGPADRDAWSGIIAERPDLAPAVEHEVRGMASGIAGGLDFARPDQLRGLGNMVVPQQGALALLVLLDRVGMVSPPA